MLQLESVELQIATCTDWRINIRSALCCGRISRVVDLAAARLILAGDLERACALPFSKIRHPRRSSTPSPHLVTDALVAKCAGRLMGFSDS